jgi:hypothetical protein
VTMRRAAVVALLAVLPACVLAASAGATVRVSSGGSGADAWFVYEPTSPTPASAPLVVVTHGYYEFSGNGQDDALARHTASEGNIVIYPRWQTDVAVPCPGPFDIEPCMKSEVAGIKGALAFLRADPSRVQPQLDRTSYFGFSFGGIITADLANRYKKLGVPRPRAIWLDDPHDGGLTGLDEPALDDSLAGIPAATKVVCHSGAEGVVSEQGKADGSCNAVFAKLGRIPAANKALVMTFPDAHGTPALSSRHGVCAGPGAGFTVDAYDKGFCRRSFDALRSCALTGHECASALGDTPQNRFIGTWPDGTPVVGLKIQTAAPIRAEPVPARAPAPPKPKAGERADHRPTATITTVVRRDGRPIAVRGTAGDDRGVASVALAVLEGCTELTRSGSFARLRACTRPTVLFAAHGRRAWSVTLPRRLGPGSYQLLVRVTDTAGQLRERTLTAAG